MTEPALQTRVTPEEIVGVLESRGWQAEIVSRKGVPDLVDVEPSGLMKCVDGRASDRDGMRGPKTLGGVYAIAAARNVRDLVGLKGIIHEVRKMGYLPSVHGDDCADPSPMGCGFFNLWVTGQLDDLEKPEYTASEGQAAVLEAGGVYETLAGSHAETVVMINLVNETTLEPNEDQRFVVDAWITDEFGLSVPEYLTRAAETVEKLNGPKVAKIVVS